MSSGPKGVLDQRGSANSGVATVTHTAAPDLFEGEAGPLLKARPMGGRAGRPNRRTAEMAGFIQRTMGDPLHELARLAMCDPVQLVREMTLAQREVGPITKDGVEQPPITIRDALAFKRECLEAILPYVHAKRAAEDDKGEAVRPEINVNLGGMDPAALKVAKGGLEPSSFLDLIPIDREQARYAASEAGNPAESSDDRSQNYE